MADEEQAVYEQYPPFKDVRGVRIKKIILKYHIYLLLILIVIGKNTY